MRQLVDEIVETWTNGNRADALDRILELDKTTACLVAAYVYDLLDNYNKGVFGRLLQSRADRD